MRREAEARPYTSHMSWLYSRDHGRALLGIEQLAEELLVGLGPRLHRELGDLDLCRRQHRDLAAHDVVLRRRLQNLAAEVLEPRFLPGRGSTRDERGGRRAGGEKI